MIVNWKKRNAGVLVLPCMQGKTRVKVIYILPGHNDVPDADWLMARDSAKRHMKEGILVELKEEKPVVVETKVKKPKKAKAPVVIDTSIDLLTPETFPFKPVVDILKAEGMFDAISEQKKTEDGKKNLSKQWLIDYMSEVTEDWEVVLSKLAPEEEAEEEEETISEETGEVEITALTLMDLETNKATDVIAETFNLETLKKWKKEVSQPDLRVLIINQIEEVNKPPKKKGNN